MLTADNQRCAAALECYQEEPELRVQGAGRAVVLKEVRLTLDGGALCILLFNNGEGKLCLDLKLHGALQAVAHGGGGEREVPARARLCDELVSCQNRSECKGPTRDASPSRAGRGATHCVGWWTSTCQRHRHTSGALSAALRPRARAQLGGGAEGSLPGGSAL